MHIKYGFTCKNNVRFWNGAKIPDNTLTWFSSFNFLVMYTCDTIKQNDDFINTRNYFLFFLIVDIFKFSISNKIQSVAIMDLIISYPFTIAEFTLS